MRAFLFAFAFAIWSQNVAADPPIKVPEPISKSIIEHIYPLIPITLAGFCANAPIGQERGKIRRLASYLMLTGVLSAVSEIEQLAREFGIQSTISDFVPLVVMFVPKHYFEGRTNSDASQTTFRQIMGLLSAGYLAGTGDSLRRTCQSNLSALCEISGNQKEGASVTGAISSEAAKKILTANDLQEYADNLETARGESTWLAAMMMMREGITDHYRALGFEGREADIQGGLLLSLFGSAGRFFAKNSDIGFASEVVAMSGFYSLLKAVESAVTERAGAAQRWAPWIFPSLELAIVMPFQIVRPAQPVVSNVREFGYVMQRAFAKTLLASVAIQVTNTIAPSTVKYLNSLIFSPRKDAVTAQGDEL